MAASLDLTVRRFAFVVGIVAVPGLACSGGESSSEAASAAPAASQPTAAAPAPRDADQDAPLRGMMTYMADAPRFTECATGSSYVLAQEEDYLSAERAYLDAGAQGEPLLVTFLGRVARRPGMEGGEVDAVVVAAFQGAHPRQGCGPELVVARLEGTEWRLVALPGGVGVPSGAGATLLLDPDLRRAAGSTGCNRFSGSYDLEGGRLTVAVTAVTRMACPDPLAAVETDFLEALRLAGGYRFAGGLLELLGEAGTVARLSAPGS